MAIIAVAPAWKLARSRARWRVGLQRKWASARTGFSRALAGDIVVSDGIHANSDSRPILAMSASGPGWRTTILPRSSSTKLAWAHERKCLFMLSRDTPIIWLI